MEIHQSVILMIASRLLSYPSKEETYVVEELVNDLDASSEINNAVQTAVSTIYQIHIKELREIYVSTFDLKSKLGLYLSAHEFGDSPKRGAALIKLKKIINQAGYESVDGELADYLPMLFELIAIMGNSENKARLIKRSACATQLILSQMPEENPYYPIFTVLMQFVFDPPTKEELQKLDQEREEADLEELPYPILYQ